MRSLGRRPALTLLATAACGLLLTVSPTGGAFTAAVTNSRDTAATASYFTCTRAYLADAPVLALGLNESSNATTAADFSPSSTRMTYRGSMSTTTALPKACPRDPAGAYVLNGSTSYVSPNGAATVTGPNTFTLEAWFRTTTGGGKIIGFGNTRTGASTVYDRHVYLTNGGQVVFGVYPGAVRTIQSPNSYIDGTWHHVVATLSTAGMVLYVDGARVAQDTATTTGEVTTGYWRIGYDSLSNWGPTQPTNFYYTGQLRYVAVYSTALSAAAVATHYRAGTP